MKKMFLLLLLIPVFAWATCQEPIGQVYEWEGVQVSFHQGYGNTICQINQDGVPTQYIPYVWDEFACTATLQSDPPVYLQFDESGWFDITTMPRFTWVTSVD